MYMRRLECEKTPSIYQQAGRGRLAPPVSATSPVLASSIMAIPTAPKNSIPIQPPIKRGPGRPRGTGKKPQTAMDTITLVKRRPDRPPGTKQKQPPPEATLMPTEPVMETQNVLQAPQMLVTKPLAKRRKSTPLKRMELSVTLSVAGVDISPAVFPLLQDFLQTHCETGVFTVERGGSLLNLHVQGVIAMLCSSAVDAKKQLTAAVGWTNHRPVGAGICVKKLTNKGIHTFVGMVGYCLKDRHELHFRVCMKNITEAVQREGMMLCTFYGATDMKNRVELNPNNVMQRALQFNKYLSHHPLGTSFRGCLRRMVVGGHYTPSTTWLINKGLDRSRTTALWMCYIQPGAVTLADIDQVFFWMPRIQPSRYIETTVPGLQMLKADALGDMLDSDHSSAHPERVSGNAAAHEDTEFASFIPLVSDLEAAQFDSSDVPLEGVASNCICCN
ncbi:hypothetical protein R1sor_026536 [Riccia sorocarpa]|uniref:Replitron HUH endonuclease domain-containing protein n=1 Tax=Riccia sorocarpa TaxID=122646 RepID=A0ABD3GBN1_9MARC